MLYNLKFTKFTTSHIIYQIERDVFTTLNPNTSINMKITMFEDYVNKHAYVIYILICSNNEILAFLKKNK